MTPERGVGRLFARQPAGGDLVLLDLVPPVGFAASYTQAGQYVEVSAVGQSTYFVLGGEPGEARWQLFVRPGGDVADALLALAVGADVALSTALGHGFPLAEVSDRRLFVVATGSGIAAVRPVLHERVRSGARASTEVFLGVRTRQDLLLPADVSKWKEDGVVVTLCLSREPSPDEPGFVHGYVQDALRQRALRDPAAFEGATIFAAGAAPMVDAVRALAGALGVREADVRTNY